MSENEKTYWNAIEPTFEVVNIYDGPEKFLASIADLPRAMVIVYAAHFCLSEVHNGGLLQFFWNSTGVLAPEAIEGFVAIRMPEAAAAIDQACGRLGLPYPRDRHDRQTALLAATGRSDEEIDHIFKSSDSLYRAYVEVTRPLDFDTLDRTIWSLAASENGGFDQAANRFFEGQGLLP